MNVVAQGVKSGPKRQVENVRRVVWNREAETGMKDAVFGFRAAGATLLNGRS